MTKNIFILSGHYGDTRLGHGIAQSYEQGAQSAGANVVRIDAQELTFDPVLKSGDFKGDQPLEEDVKKVQDALQWCNHLALIYPLWWGDMPGHLKGLLDRALLPGFAFQYNGKAFPDKLLKGRSARVMITSDTPGWYLKWFYGACSNKSVKRQILVFVGFEKNRFDLYSPVKGSTEKQRSKWLERAENAGRSDVG